MANSKFLVDEFNREDRFGGVEWCCFLYAASQSQCSILAIKVHI